MFNLFKKKKKGPAYDVTNLSVRDLNKGFVFDYNMKSWVVREVYEYDWGNHSFTKEYKIDSGDEEAFLSVETEPELSLGIAKALKLRKIDEDVFDAITEQQKPPAQLHLEGEVYYLHSDSAGYFKDCGKKDSESEELIAWEYLDEDEEKFISLTQWDERTVMAYSGIILEPYQISNIIPGE